MQFTNRLGGMVLSSSSGVVTFLLTTILAHGNIYVTGTHQYLSLEHTNIQRVVCRLTVPHTL